MVEVTGETCRCENRLTLASVAVPTRTVTDAPARQPYDALQERHAGVRAVPRRRACANGKATEHATLTITLPDGRTASATLGVDPAEGELRAAVTRLLNELDSQGGQTH